ncbi:VOC family protein [Streptomyces chrestomyceticus JCM 4735]|uniref:VOC family protein n=1 Tax=Streptomyces chrestomyceticus JCM 4735 TaxID=1306181 RepID=A0A7U9PVZ2_9ACTN|nr:VOC family protein [Streptomyces chrestomyceticus]GCD33050.1 VOC family protein [Streptomyces chrestomyceticus JCM 4735]
MAIDGFTTCLWFDGQAEEAAHHYLSIFKNSRLGGVVRYNEAGPGTPGEVMAVEFVLNGQKFMGLNGGPQFTFSEAVSFQVRCEDQEEVDYYWDRLTDDGEEGQCGWLKDKYGVSWQVFPTELLRLVTDSDPQKAKRATDAMLGMHKIDLAAIRAAHAGER